MLPSNRAELGNVDVRSVSGFPDIKKNKYIKKRKNKTYVEVMCDVMCDVWNVCCVCVLDVVMVMSVMCLICDMYDV